MTHWAGFSRSQGPIVLLVHRSHLENRSGLGIINRLNLDISVIARQSRTCNKDQQSCTDWQVAHSGLQFHIISHIRVLPSQNNPNVISMNLTASG